MPRPVLIDTGALLALLDPNDPRHARCSAALEYCPLPLITTEAVVTELFHFVIGNPTWVSTAWQFLRGGPIALLPLRSDDLSELERLMRKYADRPMDFADATLVRLAEREGFSTVMTVDQDFAVYRIRGKKSFRLLPER